MLVDVFTKSVYQEDLSSQIGDAAFITTRPFHPGSLVVYWNGLKQRVADVEVLNSFTFRFNDNVIAGDSILVVYSPC